MSNSKKARLKSSELRVRSSVSCSSWTATTFENVHYSTLLALLISSFSTQACTRAATAPSAYTASPAAEAFLDTLQERSFRFFWERTDGRTGLVPDRWPTRSFSSIAAIGFGLTAYPIGAERGWVTRAAAADRVLATLSFLWTLPQDSAVAGVAGVHGLFYHFLDFDTGLRYRTVELSTIDTALLMAGVLVCREYFDGTDAIDTRIRSLADSLYARVDWRWAAPRPPVIAMGWHPENGFLPNDWRGYNEAMILYVLALGSPDLSHTIDSTAWAQFTSTYDWRQAYGQEFVFFGPLFGHQYSHVWIDFRGIRDPYMRQHGIDYFENSRRATYAQRAYAIANPLAFRGYGDTLWGLTASDGPGDTTFVVDGRTRTFRTYSARGIGGPGDRAPDDGTIAPTAAASSIVFAPEIAAPAVIALRHAFGDDLFSTYGFVDAFNTTFVAQRTGRHPGRDTPRGWFDTDYLGIDEGPIVAMIENYRSGLVWRLMRQSPYIRRGLLRAGFTGGWLQ